MARNRKRSKGMLALALTTIRGRKGGFVAAFIAVLFGSAVITACGILLESAQGMGAHTERYQAATVVVGAAQTLPIDEDVDPRLGERVTLSSARVGEIERVPGVRAAIGDVSVPVSLVTAGGDVIGGPEGTPALAHGWSSAALGPFTISAGRAPAGPDEVVLDSGLAARAGITPGKPVRLAVGSSMSTYRVSGIAAPPGELTRQSALFLTDDRARQLSGQPGRVDVVGVLAEPSAGAGDIAAAIGAAVPGVVVYTDRERGEAEFLDIGDTRAFLSELSLAFGGSMVVVIMIVVASTLALSVRQRLRELALLRAIGATPKQVLRMIGAETTLVATVAAVAGLVPGIGLSYVFSVTFAVIGVVPDDFELVVGPLPVLVALVLCLLGARLGGWIAARRAAKVKPVDALGEAAVEPRGLGWFRVILGCLLVPAGIAAAIVLPLVVQGEAAAESAFTSALMLVVATALLGPRLLGGAVRVLGPWLNRGSTASGFLATANARANSRRLSAATTPLILGITMAGVQIFSATTMSAAAEEQAEDGLRADYVVTSATAGVSPELAGELRDVPGVAVATPVVRSRGIVTFASGDSRQFRAYAIQGVTPDRLDATMDLGVLDGDVARLRGNTVALSRIAGGTIGAGLGDTVELELGDGTSIRPRVVALYEKGLGLSDVTLPHDIVLEHTTNRLDFAVLVAATPGTDPAALRTALETAVTPQRVVRINDRASFVVAQREDDGESAVSLILNAVMLGYLAIAVVNTLVMATAARAREFALLQLVGATRRQVKAMMRGETRIVVIASVVIGTLVAVPALIGMSVGLTRTPTPSIPPLIYLGILAAAWLLGWAAIMISTLVAMRARPVEAIGTRE
jgi:putative ABC transport system permease protein